VLQWRNPDLDFSSLGRLRDSLADQPREHGLVRAPIGEDLAALEIVSREDDIAGYARSKAAVERLWQVCQVPDYRKVSPQIHADLVGQLYRFLMKDGAIPADWFGRHLAAMDRTDGDIDTLSNRIAQVRTWSFVANRPDWLKDPEHWQGVARQVEDRLSDALHERLAQRFVDRRTSVLMRRLRENAMLEAEITAMGDVTVEGQHVGQLLGFHFVPDPQAESGEAKTLRNVAQKALASEIETRAERFSAAADSALVLSNDGTIRWTGDPVAKLEPGDKIFEPRLRILADEHLTGPARDKVESRLRAWLKAHIVRLLGPVLALEESTEVTGLARGIAFQIGEALGVLERAKVANEVRSLDQDGRGALRKLGVRFGAYHLYLPALLKPAPRTLAAQLWALTNGGLDQKGLDEIAHLASSGRTSIPVDPKIAAGLYRAAGFRVCGGRAVRVDILERLADLIRPAIAYRPGITPGAPPPGAADGDGFVATVSMTSLVGCSGEDFASILKSLGYVMDRRSGPAITVPLVAAAPTTPAAPAPDAAPAGGEPAEAQAEVAADAAPSPGDVEAAATETGGQTEPAAEAALASAEFEAAAEALEQAAMRVAEPSEAPSADTEERAAEAVRADTAAAGPEAVSEPEAPSVPGDELAAAPGEPASADRTRAPSETASEPALIEVWRQGRRQFEGRPNRDQRGRQNRDRRQGRAAGHGERPQGETRADPAQGDRPARQDRPDRRPERRAEGQQTDRPQHHRPSAERPPGERPGGQRPGGASRSDDRRGPRPDQRGPRPDFRNQGGQGSQGRRDKQPDPDSPFAKLLALKAQLEENKNGKR
jgi:ATP-dependent RNA helicase SUPV3L1/SUV3